MTAPRAACRSGLQDTCLLIRNLRAHQLTGGGEEPPSSSYEAEQGSFSGTRGFQVSVNDGASAPDLDGVTLS
ncbi:hypothetical protein [Nonomuraea sp. SYSU D8015]|uniref:hypothetical protein n=1 Tax=Nonomuraea sp. SYSU D8015 TaxID=2593644 RepID=UPI001660D637|nr:hypothetical protein [Nonomuraea sp. SYSU D8015]